jgi:hypothetical protein
MIIIPSPLKSVKLSLTFVFSVASYRSRPDHAVIYGSLNIDLYYTLTTEAAYQTLQQIAEFDSLEKQGLDLTTAGEQSGLQILKRPYVTNIASSFLHKVIKKTGGTNHELVTKFKLDTIIIIYIFTFIFSRFVNTVSAYTVSTFETCVSQHNFILECLFICLFLYLLCVYCLFILHIQNDE